MKAIGYIRASTDEQSEHGVSLDAQEAKLRAFCDLYSIELVAIVKDPGENGKSLNRPGLQEALDRLRHKEAGGIIVNKLDWLSRSLGDWDQLIRGYFGEKAGFQLWSVGEAINTRTAAGRLVLNLLMSVAQWERETISERTRDALRYKKSRGERVGGVPYGWRLPTDGGKELVLDDQEQEVIGIVNELRAAGYTLQKIAAELNARRIYRRGGGSWEQTFVSGLLKRAA
jgi:DNA invertase Pin-like site-specific DNA recombinase